MNAHTAHKAFNEVSLLVSPYCQTFAVSGAARREDWRVEHRGRPLPNNVDAIAIPHNHKLMELRDKVKAWWGQDYPVKLTVVRGCSPTVTIHWVSKEQFGLAQFLITGPKEYTHHAAACWHPGKFKNYRMYRSITDGSRVVETHEEKDVFAAFHKPWIKPEKREKFQ